MFFFDSCSIFRLIIFLDTLEPMPAPGTFMMTDRQVSAGVNRTIRAIAFRAPGPYIAHHLVRWFRGFPFPAPARQIQIWQIIQESIRHFSHPCIIFCHSVTSGPSSSPGPPTCSRTKNDHRRSEHLKFQSAAPLQRIRAPANTACSTKNF